MSDYLVTMKVDHGRFTGTITEKLPAVDACDAIRDLADEPDVTVTISGADSTTQGLHVAFAVSAAAVLGAAVLAAIQLRHLPLSPMPPSPMGESHVA
jgi:hypothetical protein